jgi:mono/diheme cytochrome c family protein
MPVPYRDRRSLIPAVGWLWLAGCQAGPPAPPPEPASPQLTGGTVEARGRYLAIIGGCNDCHTEGYLQREGNVPEADWLLGSRVGWRGPWGTTYPANLRLTAQDLNEDQWVETLRTRTELPPMPWSSVRQLADADARALYRYLRSLGPGGEYMPAAVPPDQDPATPYLSLDPVIPGG